MKLSDQDKLKVMCDKCSTPKFALIDNPEEAWKLFGKQSVRPIMCDCRLEQVKKDHISDMKDMERQRLDRLLGGSMMNKQMINFTFDSWDESLCPEKYKTLGQKFCDNWEGVKENNNGIFFYGTPGGGKTYLVSCIANELIRNQNVPVAFISPITFINRIYNTYGNNKESESMIINSLNNAHLLIIDDLGAENSNGAKAKEILYQVLDNRLRLGKPLIVTSNFSMDQLKNKLDYDGIGRSVDRLLEMCSVIQIENESIRQKKAKDKRKDFMDMLKS